MAIRPTDFQASIFQATQTAAVTQRAEDAPRAAQQAAQASFAAHVQEREERVSDLGEALGNQVDPNAERDARGDEDAHERRRAPFRDVVEDAAGIEEPHLIDFTA